MLMGAGSEMISKMKQNRALRKKPKHNIFVFKEIEGIDSLKFSRSKLKKLSPKEFKAFRLKLKQERAQRGLKLSLLFISILLIMIFVTYYFLNV